ncbi:MAG: DNA polymerase III subunit delta [Balneolaceae bacterium]|nr:DNA polymerase III subunit delta [Balneolaceae bacterium]
MAKKTSIELYQEALTELRSEHRKPIYAFCGEEEFFLDKLRDEAERLIPDEHKDFNYDLIYARDKTPEQVLGIVRSYPMMAEFRLVIVQDFLSLNITSYNTSGSGGGLDELLPYVEQPNPTTLLILIDSKKPSGSTKIGKALNKSEKASLFEFESVPDYRLPDWIGEWIKKNYKQDINPAAAQMLAQFVGSNLQLLSTEIDKVCTFVDTSATISEEHVKKVIGFYREYSVFELKDAVIARDLEKSLFIAEQILQHSKADTGEIIRTVGFFYNLFSNIWQILRLAAQGNSKKQVQNEMGIKNNWYFNKLWEDASSYRLGEMPLIFETLLDADRAAKGFTKMDPPTIFLLMIKRIIN